MELGVLGGQCLPICAHPGVAVDRHGFVPHFCAYLSHNKRPAKPNQAKSCETLNFRTMVWIGWRRIEVGAPSVGRRKRPSPRRAFLTWSIMRPAPGEGSTT